MTRSRSNLRAPKAISPSAAPRRRDALLRRDRESRRPSCPSRQCASGRQRPWRSPEPWPSAGLRDELRQPHQIVGGGCEGEGPSDTIAAAEPGLLLPGHDLDPAERFLDAFPVTLADGIAAVLRRAAVDRRAATAGVLRDMWRYPHRAQFVDEVLRVIGLVGAERDPVRPV